ncbi:MAG TPA: hypothetical protein VGG88_11990, partial [Gaiellaceae bacterium]
MSTNGAGQHDLAALEAGLEGWETRADALKLAGQRVLAAGGVVAGLSLVTLFTPWLRIARVHGVAVAKTLTGTSGAGWLVVVALVVALVLGVIGYRTRVWFVSAAGALAGFVITGLMVAIATSPKSTHPYLPLGAGPAHGGAVKTTWGLYATIIVCVLVAVAMAVVAVLTRMWDAAEVELDHAESALAADKPGLLRIENLVTHFPIKAGLLKRT